MFETLLAKIAAEFAKASVPYMVIGGQAVLLYGEPRLTKDIDVTLGVGLEGLPTVKTLVERLGLRLLVDPEEFTRRTMVLPCEDPDTGIRVDLIFSDSPYEQQALKRVRSVTLRKTEINFASPEDVIIHKVIAGRPRDLEDVKSILLKNPTLDRKYIKKWLADFSEALHEPFLDRFDKILP